MPAPLPIDVPLEKLPDRAPYAWFCEEGPKEPLRPLTPVLSPARQRSGMKVTEVGADQAAIVRQHKLNSEYAARGKKQMESRAFGEAFRPKENLESN
jgi:hypothetical protein